MLSYITTNILVICTFLSAVTYDMESFYHPAKNILLSFSCYRWGSWSSEKLRKFSKIIQTVGRLLLKSRSFDSKSSTLWLTYAILHMNVCFRLLIWSLTTCLFLCWLRFVGVSVLKAKHILKISFSVNTHEDGFYFYFF